MSSMRFGATQGWTLDPQYTHLNHGSFGAVTQATAAAQADLGRQANGRPVSWYSTLAQRVGEARVAVCDALGIPHEAGALTVNASAAATAVFASLDLGAGDEVLASDHAYGAVLMAAQRWAARLGAHVTVVPIPLAADADEVVDRFERAVTPRTRAVLIDQVSSHTAREFPTARVAERMRERGIVTVVDGSHAPGLIERPFEASGGDLWFGNLHKWCCAPAGSAMLAARAPFRDRLWPAIDSWGGNDPYPERFDYMGTADRTPLLVSRLAYDELDAQFGWTAIRRYVADTVEEGAHIVAAALEDATGEPATVAVPTPALSMRLVRLPGRLGATHEQADSYRIPLATQAGCECGFGTFQGVGYLRLSAHAYNCADDYQAFAERGVPLLVRWAREGR